MKLSRESTPIDLHTDPNLELSERDAHRNKFLQMPHYSSQLPHNLSHGSGAKNYRAHSEERKQREPDGINLSQNVDIDNLSVCINESEEEDQDSNMKAVLDAIMQA